MAHSSSSTMLDQHQPLSPNPINSYSSASSSTFDVADFFNLDMLGGADSSSSTSAVPSGAASSSSRSSSRSPSGSFAHLPETPPQPDMSGAFIDFESSLGLLGGVGVGSSSSSGAGGHSAGSYPGLDEDSIFGGGFGSSVDFFKPGTDPLAGLSHSPFDLFASLSALTTSGAGTGGSATSGNANGVPSTTAADPSSTSSSSALHHHRHQDSGYPYAIDPQLVGSPAPSSNASPNSGEETEEERSPEERREDEDRLSLTIAPVKVGGKGKARRGTVQSGGISKKSLPGPQSIFGNLSNADKTMTTSSTSVSSSVAGGAKMTKPTTAAVRSRDDKDDDGDDWRPSPEEYQKMSSKEKRQLRNKISARNFRVRRKEYIHTLEGDIADRDRLIEAIRNELGSTKSENHALRQEVAALKKAILEGRASPMLPPPAPLSPLSPMQSFASIQTPSTPPTASSSSGSSSIIKPNTHKDLPTSPRLAASGSAGAFWGGQTGFGGLGGGVTPVHTAIIPETNFGTPKLGENINPTLNHAPQTNVVMSHILAQLNGEMNAQNGQGSLGGPSANGFGGFDAFADVNPFTLKTLDAYRMQLWSRVALQTQQQQQKARYPSPPSTNSSPSSSPSASPNPSLSGLASGLRPQYFASANPSSPTSSRPFASFFFGGKGYLPSPPSSPKLGEKERTQKERVGQQVQQLHNNNNNNNIVNNGNNSQGALLAALASHTILQKMGQAFWDAFSGTHEKPGKQQQHQSQQHGATVRSWDADKVRRVLEGKAVLRVVDVEPTPMSGSTSTSTMTPTPTDALEESMRSLSISSAAGMQKEDNSKDEKKGGFFGRMRCPGGCSTSN